MCNRLHDCNSRFGWNFLVYPSEYLHSLSKTALFLLIREVIHELFGCSIQMCFQQTLLLLFICSQLVHSRRVVELSQPFSDLVVRCSVEGPHRRTTHVNHVDPHHRHRRWVHLFIVLCIWSTEVTGEGGRGTRIRGRHVHRTRFGAPGSFLHGWVFSRLGLFRSQQCVS